MTGDDRMVDAPSPNFYYEATPRVGQRLATLEAIRDAVVSANQRLNTLPWEGDGIARERVTFADLAGVVEDLAWTLDLGRLGLEDDPAGERP